MICLVSGQVRRQLEPYSHHQVPSSVAPLERSGAAADRHGRVHQLGDIQDARSCSDRLDQPPHPALNRCQNWRGFMAQLRKNMDRRIASAIAAVWLCGSASAFAACVGSTGPGGPCSTGPGGGLSTGPGGGLSTGPGGGRSTGPGGGLSTGPGGGLSTGPGGGLSTGPGGGLSTGPGGGRSTGPSGGLSTGPGGGCSTGPGPGPDKWNRPNDACK